MRFFTEDEFPAWDRLVDASPQGSLFCNSWWLKAAADDIRVLGYFEHGRLVAGIPLFFKKRLGMPICTMPPLTYTWGVVIENIEGKPIHQKTRQAEILDRFARHLAHQLYFVQRFHPSVSNWLPFQWQGFRQVSRVTYVIDQLYDLDLVWVGMRENLRREIRKAQKRGMTVVPCKSEVVAENLSKTYARQALSPPREEIDLLSRVFHAARQNAAGECFCAQDVEGRVHAAAMLVWDRKRAYYLAGGADPALRTSGASSLLMWHMIQFAAAHSAIFDFEGSQIPAIERFFRAFGASQVWYQEISRMPRCLRAAFLILGKA